MERIYAFLHKQCEEEQIVQRILHYASATIPQHVRVQLEHARNASTILEQDIFFCYMVDNMDWIHVRSLLSPIPVAYARSSLIMAMQQLREEGFHVSITETFPGNEEIMEIYVPSEEGKRFQCPKCSYTSRRIPVQWSFNHSCKQI